MSISTMSSSVSNKLLIICGPTATGKTELALSLAKKFHGELVSADSRQIYIGMNIGTGKDLPVSAKFKVQSAKFKLKEEYYQYGRYDVEGVPLWLLDVARPDQEFSVAHYHTLATHVIQDIFSRGKLPIVVGGTGLYIKSLLEHIPTMSVPQDLKLRETLSTKTTTQLQHILQEKDRSKFESMNNSDRHNPRRLVRAIEVADQGLPLQIRRGSPYEFNTLEIGLSVSPEQQVKRIKDRVHKRVGQGIIEEVKTLLKNGYSWDLPSMQTLGYKEWQFHIEGKKTQADTLEEWIQNELHYAKRQMTWFKKQSNITWYSSSNSGTNEMIEQTVGKWYTKISF